ncbi:MAG: ribonuclease P protein subunit [Candidatus Diapherotrites archaeon]|nr:ribonuclease P protein subunit [Candidatus Diapherotrites archaeon]
MNPIIGCPVEVVRTTSPGPIVKGVIADETLKTITVRTEKGDKQLQKRSIRLRIGMPSGIVEVEGHQLMQRPHERLKKLWKNIR